MTGLTHLIGVKDLALPADSLCVGPDVTLPEAKKACPSCGASLRPGATFCGQCYADFRPPPAPAPAVQPTTPGASAAYGAPAPDPLTAPLLDVVLPPVAAVAPVAAVPAQAGPSAPRPASPTSGTAKPQGWPCSRCEHLNAFSDLICTVCAAPFLAKVAEETAVRINLPLVGDLTRYGRGQRAAIALGAIALLLIPLALLTLLMTHAQPKGTQPATSGGSVSTSTNGGSSGSGTTGDVSGATAGAPTATN